MANVLIVHDSETIRGEIARELQAEEFEVAEAESAQEAVREIWQGSFAAVVIGDRMNVNGRPLDEHLRDLAPEIIAVRIGRTSPAKLARKVADLLDGAAAGAA